MQHNARTLPLLPGTLSPGRLRLPSSGNSVSRCLRAVAPFPLGSEAGQPGVGLVGMLPRLMFHIRFRGYLCGNHLGSWHALKYELGSGRPLSMSSFSKLEAKEVLLKCTSDFRKSVDSLSSKRLTASQSTQLPGGRKPSLPPSPQDRSFSTRASARQLLHSSVSPKPMPELLEKMEKNK